MATGNVLAGGVIYAEDVEDELEEAGRGIASTASTVANTTSETAIATFPIAANDAAVGAVYVIRAWGTAAVTGTPTITFRGRLGGAGGTSMAALGAVTVRSGATDGQWDAEFRLAVATIGGSGTWAPILKVGHNFLTSATTYTMLGPATAAPVTKDSTIANDMVLTAQWSAASASNTITCRGFEGRRVS